MRPPVHFILVTEQLSGSRFWLLMTYINASDIEGKGCIWQRWEFCRCRCPFVCPSYVCKYSTGIMRVITVIAHTDGHWINWPIAQAFITFSCIDRVFAHKSDVHQNKSNSFCKILEVWPRILIPWDIKILFSVNIMQSFICNIIQYWTVYNCVSCSHRQGCVALYFPFEKQEIYFCASVRNRAGQIQKSLLANILQLAFCFRACCCLETANLKKQRQSKWLHKQF